MSEIRSSEGEAGLAGATVRRCSKELAVGSSAGDQGGFAEKKMEAVVRKGSAETQEYESCQLSDMDVDMDENKEDLNFIHSALSSSAGWHGPKLMCDRQCGKEGFMYYDIAPVMVEDDGEPLVINLCTGCHNSRHGDAGVGNSGCTSM